MLSTREVHDTTNFMQDEANCYMDHKVKQCLENNGIEVLEWPGNSDDLNHTENAWKELKKVHSKSCTSLHEMKKEIICVCTQNTT